MHTLKTKKVVREHKNIYSSRGHFRKMEQDSGGIKTPFSTNQNANTS